MNYLTRKDLTKRWGVSERTIDRWVEKKGLPRHKFAHNNRVVFDIKEIEEWEQKMMGIGNQD